MVLDTSAVIAILQNEPEAELLINELENADKIRISAASLVETGNDFSNADVQMVKY